MILLLDLFQRLGKNRWRQLDWQGLLALLLLLLEIKGSVQQAKHHLSDSNVKTSMIKQFRELTSIPH